MKRFFVKATVMTITAILLFSIVAGCDGAGLRGENGEGETPIDVTKTQLYVGYYDGGLGRTWIQQVKTAFEEEYAETEFEPGKKGVQVNIDPDKVGLNGGSLIETIDGKRNQIFFVENADYHNFISRGKIAEITDVVKAKADNDENRTVEQKLDTISKNYYDVGGKYYALPYYEGFMGLNYNIDLFEKRNYYFAYGKSADGMDFDEDDIGSLFITDRSQKKSVGPDGVENTDDDGLPVTYADFKALLMRILSYGDTPMIWNGNYKIYLVEFMNALWADYEGAEQMKLNWSCSGTATDLVNVSSDGKVTPIESTKISGDNAYMLQKQAGKYYALDFAKICVENSRNYYVDSFSNSLTHLDAQRRFVKGGQGNYENIAILLDGNWWETEASAQFDSDPNSTYGKLKRKFGLMPNPKASREKANGKRTILTMNNSMMFVNANTSETMMPVAKAFVSFVHTDAMLNVFTRNCNMMRPFNYELTDETLAAMSNYGKEMYKVHTAENIEIMDSYPSTEEAIKNTNLLNPKTWGWTTKDGDSNPFVVFKNKPVMTAATYFNGLYDNYSTSWNSKWIK